jgi:thiol-disulfide isomerase/thioredoxin
MPKSLAIAAAATLLGYALLSSAGGRLAAPAGGVPSPAFTHTAAAEWINSPPLTLESLRGKVVLLDFWTFACWNCYRSFPWLNDVEARLHDRGLRVIGVHTPEFDRERVRDSVEKKIAEYGLKHPVMMDNDFSYWNAMNNRYWPAFYLIDRQGRVRAHYAGETHRGDAQARRIEADIGALLSEPG